MGKLQHRSTRHEKRGEFYTIFGRQTVFPRSPMLLTSSSDLLTERTDFQYSLIRNVGKLQHWSPRHEKWGEFFTIFGSQTVFPRSPILQLLFHNLFIFTRLLTLFSSQAVRPVPTKAVHLHSLALFSNANV